MSNVDYVQRIIKTQPLGWSYRNPPALDSFSWEEIDILWWQDLVGANWKWAVYAGAIYIVTIFGLQAYMRNRPAFELKMPLFWWNFVLGVFSIIGFVRTMPGFLAVLSDKNGFYNTICSKKGLDIPTAFWILLFILSKFWELGDTVFIVLRKRPLIFLQWYHHVVTMSVVWILGTIKYLQKYF